MSRRREESAGGGGLGGRVKVSGFLTYPRGSHDQEAETARSRSRSSGDPRLTTQTCNLILPQSPVARIEAPVVMCADKRTGSFTRGSFLCEGVLEALAHSLAVPLGSFLCGSQGRRTALGRDSDCRAQLEAMLTNYIKRNTRAWRVVKNGVFVKRGSRV